MNFKGLQLTAVDLVGEDAWNSAIPISTDYATLTVASGGFIALLAIL